MNKLLSKDLEEFLSYLKDIAELNQFLTVDSYRAILEEMVDYMFDGDMNKATFENIAKIKGSQYSIQWLKPLESKYKSATINKRIAVLSRLYTYMISELYCTVNIAKTIPRSKGLKKDKRIVTKNEAITLLKYVEQHKNDNKLAFRNYLMISILLSNGLRCSELQYLRINDIDLETGKTDIVRWCEEGGVKFSKRRIVFINKSLLEDLNIYINKYRPNNGDKEILFLSKSAKQMTARDILRTVNKVSEKSGLEKINTHALRSCHSSIMINEEHDDADIIRRELGHSNINTTLNHYFNSDLEKLEKLSNSNPLFQES